jgi:hypothetical protein
MLIQRAADMVAVVMTPVPPVRLVYCIHDLPQQGRSFGELGAAADVVRNLLQGCFELLCRGRAWCFFCCTFMALRQPLTLLRTFITSLFHTVLMIWHAVSGVGGVSAVDRCLSDVLLLSGWKGPREQDITESAS